MIPKIICQTCGSVDQYIAKAVKGVTGGYSVECQACKRWIKLITKD